MDATISWRFGLIALALGVCGGGLAQPANHYFSGAVLDAQGNPIAGAVVTLGTPPVLFEREANRLTQSGEDGRFRIGVPYAGDATLAFWHPDYISATLRADTGAKADVALRRGEVLEGAVTAPASVKGRIVVSVLSRGDGFRDYTRADADGRFRFGNLASGPCAVEARAESRDGTIRLAAWTSATVRTGGGGGTLDISLPGGASAIAGSLADATGFPVMGEATLYMNSEAGSFIATGRCGATGEFLISGAPSGEGVLVLSARDRGSLVREVSLDGGELRLDPVILGNGLPLRCSFLNTPAGTRAIHVLVMPGKVARPDGGIASVRALLDSPAVWTGALRGKSEKLDVLQPGEYTLLAYPLDSSTRDLSVFERAELMQNAPVYMNTFTVAAHSTGATVAAAFPADQRPMMEAARAPMHPIIGRWAYTHEGSVWTRIFTADGRCILTEGPATHWTHPYVILGENRVAVLVDEKRRIHVIRDDGKLDIEGQFVATKAP
ncbi:MAG: carboxypeptidase regulatory-like domain-containing protein [Candidatus Hydrogenedentes bacterium]|nr:carboxypeptidase regulatory-like domain-containing protein [Candidatus Hydrogenedentota bacterium]